jgi:sulfide:quinone oxidoreductase
MRCVVLGGGFGGLAVANELKRLLPEAQVTVIDRSEHFYVGAAKTWVLTGEADVRQVTHSRRALAARGIEFLQEEILSINPRQRTVTTPTRTLESDYLVVALGADTSLDRIPGLAEAGHSFYQMDAARRTKAVLDDFTQGDLVLLIPRAPFKCPPGPYEAILMIADLYVKRGLRDRVNLSLITLEGNPMATAGPAAGALVREELDRARVKALFQHRTTSVDSERRLIHFESGEPVRYDLLLAVPPHFAPKCVVDAGLTDGSGWIPVQPETLAVAGLENVFAIGDVTTLMLPGRFREDAPLFMPKAGTAAELQGHVVAKNIAARESSAPETARFDGTAVCYLETGDMHAVKGEGSFFELPHPVMKSQQPDMVQYEAKKEWAREVARRLLG